MSCENDLSHDKENYCKECSTCHDCLADAMQVIQTENAKLKDEVERLRTLYKNTVIALVTNGGKANDESIEKDINKIKAVAIRAAIDAVPWYSNRSSVSIDEILLHANKVEKGND